METHICWLGNFVSHPHATNTPRVPDELRSVTNWLRSDYDQELDSLLVGPIPVGVNKFIFEADPPDLKRIPASEILGVTVILLTCSYDGREFVRVGYYVNNEYDSEDLNAEPPAKPIIERVKRNVLAEKPRVTRFAIKWFVFPPPLLLLSPKSKSNFETNLFCFSRDSDASAPAEYPPEQPEADVLDDDGANYGAEERELEAALKKELDDADKEEPPAGDAGDAGDDQEMGGVPRAEVSAQDEESDASEDLEAESSDSDEEDDEEEFGENEGDDDVEMGDDSEQKGESSANNPSNAPSHQQPQSEVMAH